MIKNLQQIKLNGRTIIEKLKVITPLRQSPEFDDEACFLFFSEGSSEIVSPTERISILEHESVLLKCGTYLADLFQNTETGICEVCVIHLFPDILEKIFKDEIPFFVKHQKSDRYSFRLSKRNAINHFIESLNFYFDNPGLAKEELVYLKIKELVLLLLHTEAANSIIDLYSYLFTPQQANIVEVVESHLYADLNIEQLAFLARQSLSSFKRNFKKHFNDTPANYIRNKRLQKAADLLSYSSYTINEICFHIGYEDSVHFSKIFQKKFGILPSKYRNASK
ncbi:helix-turn-helix transcriptional regulator [Membranihabitans maritimus]|uniref:helix-turn-helix transcriptional regulator n=1 Tax=Membranihabitans maritimus TaxID=2904244 RepID=UPI001F3B1F73|nr:AraC family transcriptional regulator [Membranihabitans maritimus]